MTSGCQGEKGFSLMLRPQPVDPRPRQVGFWRPGLGTGESHAKARPAEPKAHLLTDWLLAGFLLCSGRLAPGGKWEEEAKRARAFSHLSQPLMAFLAVNLFAFWFLPDRPAPVQLLTGNPNPWAQVALPLLALSLRPLGKGWGQF